MEERYEEQVSFCIMIRISLITNHRIENRLLELGYTSEDMSAIRMSTSVRRNTKLTSASEFFLLLRSQFFTATIRLDQNTAWSRGHDITTQGQDRQSRAQSSSATADRHLEDVIYVLPTWLRPRCLAANAAAHRYLHVRCIQIPVRESGKRSDHGIKFFSCNGRLAESDCSVASG